MNAIAVTIIIMTTTAAFLAFSFDFIAIALAIIYFIVLFISQVVLEFIGVVAATGFILLLVKYLAPSLSFTFAY